MLLDGLPPFLAFQNSFNMATRIKTFTSAKQYSFPGYVESMGANALMFINEGEAVVKLMGLVTIRPAESLVISQVGTEAADHTAYTFEFLPAHPDSTGTIQLLVVLGIGIQS